MSLCLFQQDITISGRLYGKKQCSGPSYQMTRETNGSPKILGVLAGSLFGAEILHESILA